MNTLPPHDFGKVYTELHSEVIPALSGYHGPDGHYRVGMYQADPGRNGKATVVLCIWAQYSSEPDFLRAKQTGVINVRIPAHHIALDDYYLVMAAADRVRAHVRATYGL
jgi:hypothetical protein